MVPVSGFTGPCPEMNTKSPATTAWEYGPAGAGPFSAITVFLIWSPFLSLYHFQSPYALGFYGFRPVHEPPRSSTRSGTAALPDLPAGRHPRLLHDAVLSDQAHLIMQIHRAADVVGDYLQRVADREVAVLVHREHTVLL